MTNDRPTFTEIASKLAARDGRELMVPVIEKELLHYEILQAMDEAQLLDDLVFQGGTCLRLCYSSQRYSEDLDFAGGCNFDPNTVSALKNVLENCVGKRYGLKVDVKEPQSLHDACESEGITVDTWKLSVATAPQRPDIPRQRISIEIASIPAHTRETRSLSVQYAELPASYSDVLVFCETLEEICADKLKAYVCAKNTRYRDLWDLRWLASQSNFNKQQLPELLANKLRDYAVEDVFCAKLPEKLATLGNVIESPAFMSQMKRFLPTATFNRTVARTAFRTHTAKTVQELYEQAGF